MTSKKSEIEIQLGYKVTIERGHTKVTKIFIEFVHLDLLFFS